jgi:PAS domain S-box-containing protein
MPQLFSRKRLIGLHSPFIRYGLVLFIVVAAVALRALLNPVMGQQSVAVFLGAILIGAWFGRLGPALLCMVLLHIVHGFWFQDPPGLFEPTTASLVTTGAYYVVAIMVGLLSQKRASAQRRAEAEHSEAISQREHLHATLSCMADGVLVTDVNGRVLLMNRAAESLTGWSSEKSTGKPWSDIILIRREDCSHDVENPIERVLTENRVVHESMPLVITTRVGHTIPIAYSAAPVHDDTGQNTGVVLVFRDESNRRRTELALRNADRRKDEFLATLAHELRNPLAPISMGLELLELSADDRLSAGPVRSMMRRQVDHMVRLIDDLLDVSRITRGKLELRKSQVDLRDIVRDAVEATQPLIEKSSHQLAVQMPDRPLLLFADAGRLTQVFTNLLNNAAKFTPREGRIELTAEQTAGELMVTVSDTGIGIAADRLDYVFDMFAQIHENNGFDHNGLGIGLTLVKRLVEMHGGRVEARSRGQNLGSEFQVYLPMLPEPPADAHDTSHDFESAKPAVKQRILVVDDNADALESLSRLVTLMDNEVRRARDGLEALEVARAFKPDVVLMDLGMPNLDGYEAARRIRQEPWGRAVVLVATTGWGQDEDRRRTAEAGFDRHLVKPISMSALQEVLSSPASSHAGRL